MDGEFLSAGEGIRRAPESKGRRSINAASAEKIMKQKTVIGFVAVAVIALIAAVIFSFNSKEQAEASAPTGYTAIQASSSQITLTGNQMLQIFATSTCVSRIITPHVAQGGWMRILFEDSATVPSPGTGHLVVASSTSVYDSGLYGCGLWRAFNNSASTTIFTITEFTGFR